MNRKTNPTQNKRRAFFGTMIGGSSTSVPGFLRWCAGWCRSERFNSLSRLNPLRPSNWSHVAFFFRVDSAMECAAYVDCM